MLVGMQFLCNRRLLRELLLVDWAVLDRYHGFNNVVRYLCGLSSHCLQKSRWLADRANIHGFRDKCLSSQMAALALPPVLRPRFRNRRLRCRFGTMGGWDAGLQKGLCFDALLRLPEAAYEQRTGQPLPRAPKYIYETGFNVEGWGEESSTYSALEG